MPPVGAPLPCLPAPPGQAQKLSHQSRRVEARRRGPKPRRPYAKEALKRPPEGKGCRPPPLRGAGIAGTWRAKAAPGRLPLCAGEPFGLRVSRLRLFCMRGRADWAKHPLCAALLGACPCVKPLRRPYAKEALKRPPEGKKFATRRPERGGNCGAMAREGRARPPAPARGRGWGLSACGFRACAFFVCVGARIGQKIPPLCCGLARALCRRAALCGGWKARRTAVAARQKGVAADEDASAA